MYETYDHIEVEKADRTVVIELARPSVLNAITERMAEDINNALNDAHEDEAVESIIITGAGRGFCSGGDVSVMPEREPSRIEWKYHLANFQNITTMLRKERTMTIAAVNGPAVGGGMDIALACDFRVMDRDAYLKQQYVDIGLVPGEGGAWLLAKLIGESAAKKFILTNDPITAEDAKRLDLAYSIAKEGETMAEAKRLANVLNDKPSTAKRRTKELLHEDGSLERYLERAYDIQWDLIHDPEHREATESFIDETGEDQST